MLLQAPQPGRVPTPAPTARPGQRRTGSVQWRDAAWAGLGWAGPGWAGLVWDTGEMEIAWCVGMPGHVTTCLMHAAVLHAAVWHHQAPAGGSQAVRVDTAVVGGQ